MLQSLWTWTTIVWSQVIIIIFLIYFYYRQKFSYWKNLGVKGPSPLSPLGNLHTYIAKGQTVVEKNWLRQYGTVYGYYQGTDPVLTIADPTLIKQVLVKDFHNFVNRNEFKFDNIYWGKNLFNAENEHWKRLRSILSPRFTSGKLRAMQTLMSRCVDKFVDYLDKNSQNQNGGGELNLKKVVIGFTIDVIASTTFATETNANDDRQQRNPFVENGIRLFSIETWRFFALFLLPKALNNRIGNSMGLSDARFNFFVDLSFSILEQRRKAAAMAMADTDATTKQSKQQHSDIVQMLIDAYIYDDELQQTDYSQLKVTDSEANQTNEFINSQKVPNNSVKRTLTDTEIVAQSILFFAGGFDTTAGAITHTLTLLAYNTDIQERLATELCTALHGLDPNSQEYFETTMNGIPYLDAVLKETLRLYPPFTRLQRRVNVSNYQLGGIPLRKDQTVEIAVYAVHHSPEYYSEPERFDPDRFMPENKHLLVPNTYLSFGDGPRNCIGMRFAYQEIKLCLARILPRYRFAPSNKNPRTLSDLTWSKLGLLSIDAIDIRLEKRCV